MLCCYMYIYMYIYIYFFLYTKRSYWVKFHVGYWVIIHAAARTTTWPEEVWLVSWTFLGCWHQGTYKLVSLVDGWPQDSRRSTCGVSTGSSTVCITCYCPLFVGPTEGNCIPLPMQVQLVDLACAKVAYVAPGREDSRDSRSNTSGCATKLGLEVCREPRTKSLIQINVTNVRLPSTKFGLWKPRKKVEIWKWTI